MPYQRIAYAIVVLAGLIMPGYAVAGFGQDCRSPTFDKDLVDKKFSERVVAAIKATCAYHARKSKHDEIFAKSGWSWSLLPKANQDVKELTELADQATAANFATGDDRALSNIKSMNYEVGYINRWISEQNLKYDQIQKQAARQGAARAAAARRRSYSAGRSDDAGYSDSQNYRPPTTQSYNPAAPGYIPSHKSTGLCPPGTGMFPGEFCN